MLKNGVGMVGGGTATSEHYQIKHQRLDVIPELGFSNNIDALSYQHNDSSHQHHFADVPEIKPLSTHFDEEIATINSTTGLLEKEVKPQNLDVTPDLGLLEVTENSESTLKNSELDKTKNIEDPEYIKAMALLTSMKKKYEECMIIFNNALNSINPDIFLTVNIDLTKLKSGSEILMKGLSFIEYMQTQLEPDIKNNVLGKTELDDGFDEVALGIKLENEDFVNDVAKTGADEYERIPDFDDNTENDDDFYSDNLKDNCFDLVKAELHDDSSYEVKSKKSKKAAEKEREKEMREARKIHKCNICNKGFITPLSLKKHTAKHSTSDQNSDKKLKVKIKKENLDFDNVPPLNTDADNVKLDADGISGINEKDGTEIWTCTICLKTFKRHNSFRVHLRYHTGDRPFPCDHCKENFISKTKLTQHKRTVHGMGGFKCETCDEVFDACRVLDYHRVLQHNIKNFHQCQFCDERFDAKFDLKKHRTAKHKEKYRQELQEKYKNQKHFICDLCGFSSNNKYHFGVHMLRHKDDKPFQCDKCENTFTMASALRRHKITAHTTDQPYKCEFCSKSFPVKHYLTKHSLIHTGEKNHVCDICGKAFTYSSHKSRHRKTHFK